LKADKGECLVSNKILISFFCILFFSGCNIFDPFDNPSEDEELLSAARACLDQGDYECARRFYGQLSKDSSDEMHSELAFLTLDEHALGLGGILSAIGAGDVSGGKLFTVLANQIGPSGTAAKRAVLYGAFRRTEFIRYAPLRGLVRFITSTALLSNILAETRLNGGQALFEKDDIVTSPQACIDGGIGGCAGGSCGAKLIAGPDITNVFDAASFSGEVSLKMIRELILQLSTALSSELDSGGKFSSGPLAFAQVLSNPLYSPSVSPNCFSFLLITNGLGD